MSAVRGDEADGTSLRQWISASLACAPRCTSAPGRKAVPAASDRPLDGRLALQVPTYSYQKQQPPARGGGRWDFFRRYQTHLLVLRTAQMVLSPQATRCRSTHCVDRHGFREAARGQVPTYQYQKQQPPARGGCCFWCGRWDLNPYARAHAPQTCLSANSSTAAHRVLYDGKQKKSTLNFRFSQTIFGACRSPVPVLY